MSTNQCHHIRPSDKLYAVRIADQRTLENMQGNSDYEQFTNGRKLSIGLAIALGVPALLLLYYGYIALAVSTLALCALSLVGAISFQKDRKRVYQKEFDIQYCMTVERICSDRHKETEDK